MAFVGVQPLFTQVPPNLSFSTTATFIPAPERRAAREGPAWPVPMMSASNLGTLTKRQLPMRPDEVTGVAAGISQEVILVLGFGLPEVTCRNHFGDRFAGPQARSVDVGDGVFGDPLLLVAGIEDRRAIAGADVVALAIARARVVNLEEKLEQPPIADARGIERNLDRFGVSGMIAIGRVGVGAAGIADPAR